MWIELAKPLLSPEQVQASIDAAIADYIANHPPVSLKSTKTLCNLSGGDIYIRYQTSQGNATGPNKLLPQGQSITLDLSVFNNGCQQVTFHCPLSGNYVLYGFTRQLSSESGVTDETPLLSHSPGEQFILFGLGELSDDSPAEKVLTLHPAT